MRRKRREQIRSGFTPVASFSRTRGHEDDIHMDSASYEDDYDDDEEDEDEVLQVLKDTRIGRERITSHRSHHRQTRDMEKTASDTA